MNDEALTKIETLLGSGGFIDDPSSMQAYLTSWRNGWTGTSPLVAFPKTTAQVAEIAKICHHHHVPIVPQGGNSGLVGGAIPSQQGQEIVVNLSRMNKIRDLNRVASIVTVEAGVILQNLQEAAATAGFLFPLSMASEGSAQIGGAISTNAGGTAVLRYGTMRQLVMGVEAVLANGDIISDLKRPLKDNAGYNLSQVFIGSEGTLGIITAATVKLFPAYQQTLVSIIAIPNAATALELLEDFRKECSEYLSAFEIMSQAALQLVVKHIPGARLPLKDNAPYYLLIELGSSSSIVPLRDIFEKVAAKFYERGKILDAAIAENIAQSKQFWALRENISESMRQEGSGIHFDVSIPLEKIADFLTQTEIKIKAVAPDIVLALFGHIGDGNIHYNMYFQHSPNPDALANLKKQIKSIVYGEIVRLSGSISAEHGIGIERRTELMTYKSPVEIVMMKKIKQALDPQNLMNPGKVFEERT